MSTKTILDLASFFPSAGANQKFVWDYGDRYSGFYIGENVVLTAAHTLHDVRWSVDQQGIPIPGSWSLVNATSSGVYKNTSSVVTPWSFHVNSSFYSFVNADFAANRNPYADAAIATYDTAWTVSTTSVSTRDLIGTGVFYGTATANLAAIGTTVTLEYKLNGSYGTKSGALTAIGTDTASAALNAVSGMSGGPWESNFRAINTSHTYAFGVQSTDVNGATAALITPALFDTIMTQLATGKTGSQAAQPTNYLHGSDGGDVFQGSFRPDVIYGNGGTDTLNDGDVGKSYWANDYIFGGDGDDIFHAGRGFDLLHGGDQSKPGGGTVNMTADGIDLADYSNQFANRAGIEIRINNTNQSTLYSSVAGYSTAIFVKDQVSGDIDTLISIETIKGSAGSDVVHIDTLTTSRLSGIGGSGGLNNLDFTTGKSNGEVDKLDLSGIQAPILLNLSASQTSIHDNWYSGDDPDPTFTVNLSPNILEVHGGPSQSIAVSGFNYIIGTNSYGTLANDLSKPSHCDDVIIGSSAHEIFEQTLGFDRIYFGGGDILFNPTFADMSYAYVVSGHTPDRGGSGTLIHFNGIEIDGVCEWGSQFDPWTDPTGMHEVITETSFSGATNPPFAKAPLTLYYDAATMTATITDLRDGSTMTLDNWLPFWTYTDTTWETFDQAAAHYGGSSSTSAEPAPAVFASGASRQMIEPIPHAINNSDVDYGVMGLVEFTRPWSAHAIAHDYFL